MMVSLTRSRSSTDGGDTASGHRLISIIPKVTLHLRRGQDLLRAVKDEPCPIDAEQARQVVEVEQLAIYA